MSLSPIGGKIILEGEKEYRDALKSISSELKVNYSNMTMVTAACADQEKSMETLRAKTDALRKVQESQTKQVELLRGRLEKAQQTEGVSAETVNKYRIQLNNAETALYKTTNQLKAYDEEMEKSKKDNVSMSDVLDSVCDKLGIKLPAGAKNAVQGLGSVSAGTAALAAGAAALVVALGAVYSKLSDISKEVATYAGDVGTLAQEYSITAEQVQELAYAETKLEVSNGTITSSMSKLTEKLASGSDAFKELGVRTTDSSGQMRDTYDIFMDTIDALGEMNNQTEADTIAQKLFGESFAHIKPLVEAGSKSIKDYSKAAKDSGLIMSNETVKAMDELYQKQVDVDAGWDAIKKTLAVGFAPAQSEIDDMLTEELQPILLELAEAVVPTLGDGLRVVLDLVKLLKAPALEMAGAFSIVVGTLESIIACIDAVIQGFKMLFGYQDRFDASRFYTADDILRSGAGLLKQSFETRIGRNATGTNNWRGGLTWVGENGPEIVSLPRGSRIYNNSQSMAMAGGNTYNITIDASRVREFVDIIRIAENEATSIRQGVSR